MNMNINGMSAYTQNFVGKTKTSENGSTDAVSGVSWQVVRSNAKQPNSVVDGFKRKHPEESGHVDKQVSAGMKDKETYGVSDIGTSEMSMGEYKEYITDILGKIPFHASHPYDEEVIYISDDGWEQMKNLEMGGSYAYRNM